MSDLENIGNNILYLDDDKDNLKLFNLNFRNEYKIYLAHNKNEALNIINQENIKVLITDQRMPDINGLDFIKEVQSDKSNKNIVCILLTAYPNENLLLETINGSSDIFHFMVKPWTRFEMKQILDSAIARHNSKVEKERLLKDLKSAKERAIQSDHLKSIFLANISHEIRTPLNGILGITTLIIEKEEDPDEMTIQLKEMLEQSCEDLINSVENIIKASQIQTGTAPSSITELNINDLLDSLYQRYYPLITKSGQSLCLHKVIEESNTQITVDKLKITEIFKQLLNNATKFTTSINGQISFGVFPGNELTFFVKDNGIGIDEDKNDSIFKLFCQANDNNYTRLYPGNGLGLFIAKGHVSQIGGKIWFESKVGVGSTFYFNIPQKGLASNETYYTDEIIKINIQNQ